MQQFCISQEGMDIMVRQFNWRVKRSAQGVSAIALLCAVPFNAAFAQDAAPAAASQPSTNAMENLIRLLVKQGTITPQNGQALLEQAQGEAARAAALTPPPLTAQTATADNPLPPAPPAPAGVIRVPYVPESVRRQIAEQVKAEVMGQAKAEGWAAPSNAAPDWTRRITLSGDIRVRSQSELQSRLNDTTVADIARLGASSGPINVTDLNNLPLLDTTSDRINRLRLRARIGLTADITPAVKVGLQIATGDDNSPISTNARLAGGFAKRDLWLDKAYLELKPADWIKASFGRFQNPFRSTEILFDDDLRFDGVAAEVKADKFLPKGLTLAVRGGAFPLESSSSSTSDKFTDSPVFNLAAEKRISPSKWLLSGQIEAGYTMDNGVEISGGVGYHDFHNLQGRLSSACEFSGILFPLVGADPAECSTDATRALFPRKGNTLFYIRDLTVGTPGDEVDAQRQYLGMTYKYRVLDLNASVTVPISDAIRATISGNYLHNLAFKRSDECLLRSDGINFRGALTNVEASGDPASADFGNPCAGGGTLHSGNTGWLGSLVVGHAKPRKWGEWRAMAGYRYLETDAVPDAFPDSDFHLGGTNTKGYTIGATFGVMEGVALGTRWMSANEVSGSPLSIDVLQVDLSAEF